MNSVLVTGGAGFIGSNFIRHLLSKYSGIHIVNLDLLTYAGNLDNLRDIEKDPRYTFVHGDIRDKALLTRLMSEYSIDSIVNFAAESHVDRSINHPELFVETNIMGVLTLLNAAKVAWAVGDDQYKQGVKFLQVSTDEVYGSLGADGYFTESTPLDPHSPYSASKASADLLVKSFSDTYWLPVNITRCSNNYGPYQFPEKLIALMIYNALRHETLPIYGDGLQIRDWLYVEDHCAAIDLVLHNGTLGEVYNIGGYNEHTNLQIVNTIVDYIHKHIDPTVDHQLIKHVTDRKGHDRRYAIDSQKITAALGWRPVTTFEMGIEKTIQWYIENNDWLARVTGGAYREYYAEMYEGR